MPHERPTPSSVLRRVRWGNVATLAGVALAVVLVALGPRLGGDPPPVPDGGMRATDGRASVPPPERDGISGAAPVFGAAERGAAPSPEAPATGSDGQASRSDDPQGSPKIRMHRPVRTRKRWSTRGAETRARRAARARRVPPRAPRPTPPPRVVPAPLPRPARPAPPRRPPPPVVAPAPRPAAPGVRPTPAVRPAPKPRPAPAPATPPAGSAADEFSP